VRVLVPFDAARPKTRLAGLLAPDERAAFAAAMLGDVLDALRGAGFRPRVLATAPVTEAAAAAGVALDAPVTVDDRPLSPAVAAALDPEAGPRAVVMADLALATPRALARLAGGEADLTICPGRGGGTNALVVRQGGIAPDYHGRSYLDHLRAARAAGATVREIDSFRLATDVDEPADLAEVLVHGDGAARDWLREAGVALAPDGRDGVVRERRG
jgi:2-phospho-L-lactate guanylyltransferase